MEHELPLYSIHNPEFWVAVAIVTFIVLAYRPISKLMIGGLDKRAAGIRKDIDDAQNLLAEAQNLLNRYAQDQDNARLEASRILQAAEAEAALLRTRAAEELAHSLAAREKHALDRIGQAEKAAVSEIQNIAIDVSLAATRKLLHQELNNDNQAQLTTEALGQLQQQLK